MEKPGRIYTLGLHTTLTLAPDSDSSDLGRNGSLRLVSISTLDQTSRSSAPSKTSEEIDFHYCHRILNIISDQFYDKCFDFKIAQYIWYDLDKEYGPDSTTRISHLSIEFENY